MGVSLIIPNRNNAPFLRQCLASALGQTLAFEEIIVVDDASEDDSVAVVRAVAATAPSLRLICMERRVGVSAARHAGIESATSSHVSTIDADDFFWSREKNEREWVVITSTLESKRPVIAFSDIRLVSAQGADLGSMAARREVREGDIRAWLLHLGGFVPRDFTFLRSEYFAAGGYDRAFDLYEDWDLKLRLAQRCDFRYTGSNGVAYRQNPQGLSRAPFVRHLGAMARVVWKNTSELPLPSRISARCHAMIRVGWFQRGRLGRLRFWRRKSLE